jgi:hypothetical protein
MFKRRRPQSRSGEDGAGWIYADLFLALMIVGLGSAVITSSSPSSAASTTAPATFQLSCAEFPVSVPSNLSRTNGGEQIEAAITSEISKRGWSGESAKPGLVIVFGGFSGNETAGVGDRRAKSLRATLRAAVPPFQQVEMRTGGAQKVAVNGTSSNVGGAGSFLLVVYLLFNGRDLTEDCTR